MRILYIHQYFNTPQKSGGTRSFDLASQFVKNGHQVILITTTRQKFDFPNKKRWNIIIIEGIEVHVLRNDYSNKMSALRRIISFLEFAVFSSIHILKLKADVVLATSTPLSVAIPAFIKKWVHKTPFIFEIRDVWPEAPIALGVIKRKMAIKISYWFEQFTYKNAAAIVALSTDMRNSIVNRCKHFPEITVIPNISEVRRFESARNNDLTKDSSSKKIVLYAGSVAKVNNIEYVVKLAEALLPIDNSIVFHIYSTGKGNRFEFVKAMAIEKGLLGVNFFLKDAIPKNELPAIYRESTVASSFVANIPALWANSANKFFDTLAAGKPIIINHEGWQAEEIRKYNVGFVLDANEGNLEKTAKEFAVYLNNRSLLSLQGQNAYNLAKEKYSLTIAISNYEKILKKITM
jgi:glycosyltransferase involved in cell wall biosynthesis